MPKRILASLLWGLLVITRGALAQTALYEETGVEGSPYEDMTAGESRDVPCPYGLSATVDGHYGVPFGDYMFMSDWQSKKGDFHCRLGTGITPSPLGASFQMTGRFGGTMRRSRCIAGSTARCT